VEHSACHDQPAFTFDHTTTPGIFAQILVLAHLNRLIG
jgi:hypothetical protein